MYKGRTFVREGVTVAGDYLDGDIYPVFQTPGKRRKKCKPTSEIQKKLNQKNAERKLVRLVHSNFTEDDLALHLTYSDDQQPASEEEAQKILKAYLRRLKRRYAAAGLELKYITVTEKGKRSGKVHHHLIINGGMDRDSIEDLWYCGRANSKRLQFGEDGVTALAKYMTKKSESEEGENYRRWNSSRNLFRPEPMITDGDISMGEVQDLAAAVEEEKAWKILEERYPDFVCTKVSLYRNPINRSLYIHYEMKKKEALWSCGDRSRGLKKAAGNFCSGRRK